jgi:hypothetical protein
MTKTYKLSLKNSITEKLISAEEAFRDAVWKQMDELGAIDSVVWERMGQAVDLEIDRLVARTGELYRDR